MIYYQGIVKKNNQTFIKFKNDKNEFIEVPIDLVTADRIGKYLDKFVDTFISLKFTFKNHDNKVFKLHDVITYIRPTHK